LQEAVRVHGAENLVQRAKAYSAAQRAAREESEMARAKQQEKRAVVELSGTDRAAAERGEKGRSAGSSVRRRTEEGERVGPGGVVRTNPLRRRLEGPVRRQRTSPSGLAAKASSHHRWLEGPVRWR
jgi:hypothetical protein